MLLFPNCKINLGLNITRKREDGYHDLETVFYPLPLKDALEAVRAATGTATTDILFSSSGLTVAGNMNDNLCVKAYQLLKKDNPSLPPVQMHLHKAIPMGAGLGGGSSDGASALLLLDKLFNLQLSQEKLLVYALQLGSDCPFFIRNKACFASGRGEIMDEISLDLSAYQFVLINPGIHVSTAQAFSKIVPAKPIVSAKEIVQLPVTEWKNMLMNDFEATVAAAFPDIPQIKEELYQKGAVYASMTGSGSSVYGLFPKNNKPEITRKSTWKVYYIK